jgi:small-conductance mechanosensitive channel
MSHHSHRRRHRSSDRALTWVSVGFAAGMALIGAPVLAAYFYFTPAMNLAAALLACGAALVALLILACLAGRIAAAACNLVTRAHGRYSLEKFVRDHRPHGAA